MIRKFILSDIDEIMNIWLQSSIETHDFINKEYWLENYNSVKKAILDAEVYVFVDNNSGKIVAFIDLVGNYIEGLFVLENSRSNAIGKALLDYVKSLKSDLILDVYYKNSRAIKFYKRENFTVQSYSIDEETNEIECTMIWK